MQRDRQIMDGDQLLTGQRYELEGGLVGEYMGLKGTFWWGSADSDEDLVVYQFAVDRGDARRRLVVRQDFEIMGPARD